MNAFQRLATQVAKDDFKKELNRTRDSFSFKKTKALALASFKRLNRTYEDAKKFKNWNKNLYI